MKKLTGIVLGLSLLSSVAFAKDLQIYVKYNNEIVQVCNQEALGKNPKGDVLFHYRKENNCWIMDKITYLGDSNFYREFIKNVTEEEIPTYVKGMCSLYYDPDQDEENIVAIFEEGIDSKVKKEWVEMAKKHVKQLYES